MSNVEDAQTPDIDEAARTSPGLKRLEADQAKLLLEAEAMAKRRRETRLHPGTPEHTAAAALHFMEVELQKQREVRDNSDLAIALGRSSEASEGTPLQIAESAMLEVHQNAWDSSAHNASILRRACQKLEALAYPEKPIIE